MLHGKAMAVTVAYDMYLECCEGNLDAAWFIQKPVSFHVFREKLAKQMLSYNPTKRKYAGDEHFRLSTQQPKKRRPWGSIASSSSSSSNCPSTFLTAADFAANESRCGCGDLSKLMLHLASVEQVTTSSSKTCVVCGERAYHECTICGKAMHKNPSGGRSVACFFYYHSSTFLGLARCDYKMIKDDSGAAQMLRNWTFPSERKQQEHARKCRRLLVPPSDVSVASSQPFVDE